MHHEPAENELFGWLAFIGRRLIELIALSTWCLTAWAFHEFVVKLFPLDDGATELVVRISECVLNAAALMQLIKLLFFRGKRATTPPWWQ